MTKHTDEFLQFAESVICREYTLPRDDKSTDPKGWIRGNTKIGPVLEVKTRGSEFLMPWTNWSQTWSTRSTTTTSRRHLQRRRKYLRLQADPRLKQNREDFQLLAHLQDCTYSCQKNGLILNQELNSIKLTQWQKEWTLLRHGGVPREEDGAIEFWRLKDDLQNKFKYSQYWSDDVWKSKMAWGRGNNKSFQYCTDPSGQEILYLRALHGYSGRNSIDRSLQDNILIPNNFFEKIYHIGCAVNLNSITNSGLIAGGQNSSRDRQTVFFTAVNPMHKNHQDPKELDLTKPRLASHKQKCEVHQNTVYWVDVQLAQRKGLKFYQTRSNATILYDTLPAYCISKAIVMKSEEIIYQKVYVSPRPPPTIPYKDSWTCDLHSDVARSSKDIQRIELKPNTQLSSTGRPVTRWREETLERSKFDRDTLNQEKHDKITDPTSTGEPVSGHDSTKTLRFDTQTCWKWSNRFGKNPSRWIKKRNTTLISECQECHTQLQRKQNISEFKSM